MSERRALDSPCIDVCTFDAATGTCLGCGRSLDEIEGWIGFSAAERAAIIAELPQRCARFDAERIAQATRVARQWAPTRCSRCGTDFVCGAADRSVPCWCAAYPPIDPAGDATCMCPACLAAASVRAEGGA